MSNKIDRRALLIGAGLSAATAAASAGLGSTGKGAKRFATPTEPIPVAFMMDQAATMIDFAGPWEALQDAIVGGVPGFYNYTVAPEKRLYDTTGNISRSEGRTTVAGLKFMPDHVFEDAPQPRIIIMGAQMNSDDPRKREWLKRMEPGADIVMSVCTGAFILAGTGLLDGRPATTHHDYYAYFAKAYPKVQVMTGRRFVESGKFITTGGLTSGVDGALHVVSLFYGDEVASKAAAYMEHDSQGWRTGLRGA